MKIDLFDGFLWLAISAIASEIIKYLDASSLWMVVPFVFFVVYKWVKRIVKRIVKKLLQKFLHWLAVELAKVKIEG